MIHFVYCSFEENGRNYIGVHSTGNLYDGYMGSYRDSTFSPEHRIILGYFKDRESALAREVQLHELFSVDKDPTFANLSKQTSSKFYAHEWVERLKVGGESHPHYGKKRSPETGRKISEAKKGKPCKEETKQKISKSSCGESNSQWGKKGSAHHLHGKPWPEARRRAHELKKRNQP
jgi:hypothetical protein